MRIAPYILCLVAFAGSTGCLSVCHNASRTLCKEPKQFSWRKDRCQSMALYGSWAGQAWQERLAAGCDCETPDFAAGFQSGFVEFCYAGGSGEPPPVPPRPYWIPGNRASPYSDLAEHWFAGYRLGAQVARDGGYRDQAVVPSALPPACSCKADAAQGCDACGGFRMEAIEAYPEGVELMEPEVVPRPTST
ncbi:MAG: hypothetical protein KDA37_01750, partial [Planctomycetales bacterium]|nr:hypothetical protein [Planctomycetales bacterium]